MYKICFYVPVENAERVKVAMFKAGAGKIGNYDYCSFETLGKGQFRAQPGANPYIGTINKIEYVDELKVEMVCEKNKIKEVILALKNAHPYEAVAYDVRECLEF